MQLPTKKVQLHILANISRMNKTTWLNILCWVIAWSCCTIFDCLQCSCSRSGAFSDPERVVEAGREPSEARQRLHHQPAGGWELGLKQHIDVVNLLILLLPNVCVYMCMYKCKCRIYPPCSKYMRGSQKFCYNPYSLRMCGFIWVGTSLNRYLTAKCLQACLRISGLIILQHQIFFCSPNLKNFWNMIQSH